MKKIHLFNDFLFENRMLLDKVMNKAFSFGLESLNNEEKEILQKFSQGNFVFQSSEQDAEDWVNELLKDFDIKPYKRKSFDYLIEEGYLVVNKNTDFELAIIQLKVTNIRLNSSRNSKNLFLDNETLMNLKTTFGLTDENATYIFVKCLEEKFPDFDFEKFEHYLKF